MVYIKDETMYILRTRPCCLRHNLEVSVQDMSNLYDVVKQSCDKKKNDITQVKSSFTSIVSDNKSIRDEIESLSKTAKNLKPP